MLQDPAQQASVIRRHLKFRHFFVLAAIAETGSVTDAAQRLKSSHAAVSKTKTDLERVMGQALFDSERGRLLPTLLCQMLLRTGARIGAELDLLRDELADSMAGLSGEIRIGLRSVTAEPLLARVVGRFKATRPGVAIHIVEGDMADLRDQLLLRRISLLICRHEARLFNERFDSMPMMSGQTVVLANPTNPILAGPIDWPHAVQARWCLPPLGYHSRRTLDHFETFLAPMGLQLPRDLVETPSMLMMISLVRSGDFLSFLPLAVARQLAREGLGVILDLPALPPQEPTCTIWCRDFPLTPAAQLFVQEIRSMLQADTAGEAGQPNQPGPPLELPFRMVLP